MSTYFLDNMDSNHSFIRPIPLGKLFLSNFVTTIILIMKVIFSLQRLHTCDN